MALSRVFDEMSAKNITSWNALVSGYMELGCISEAQRVFDVMPEKNTVSWTILVNGYIANRKLTRLGCSSLLMGQQVHSVILKAGVPHDVVLLTSLVDMYGKCGDIVAAFCIFESMKNKNLMSWNSIIGGYARHGLATRALEEFERMIKSGVRPDQVTFLNILSASGHGGLVEEGQLDKAEELIKGMPYEPDVVVWGALLGACGIHSSLELGAFAARGINKLKEDHPVAYSMLSKIHGERGEWNGIVGLRKMMKQRHVKTRRQVVGSNLL
ncbi:hypothetical protein GH714_022655 [Hevea brasiliensis]|uniref:Pentatricopeptide repeat-containing protein n=1 Tax=Hevea brasiliensis TaxID=3981 RepID=A0A6A6NIQ3_HEVBR|nr:hypothetical protein GH714_022655 [Hevea brasiliensis]